MGCYFTASIVIFLALSTCSSDHINLPQNDIKVQTNHTNVHFNSTTSTIPPTPAESAVHNSSSELISVPTKSPDGTKPPSPTTAPKTSHVVQPSAPAGAFVTALDANDAFSSFVYIIVCLTIVIMSYMVVKNFRRRYATARAEKYGVRRRWRDQELQPLGKDDEDEDTLFEARGEII